MRLPSATRDTFPEHLQYVYDRNERGGRLPNIFAAMGNNPEVLRAYLRLGNGLWTSCGLEVATRELAILRTAILHHSAYEWHQHVRIGKEAGLTAAQINALHHWRTATLFSAMERAVLSYVDAVAATEHPPQEVHDELAKHVPASTIVGVNLLAGYYGMTAKFLGAMEVTPEEEFVGWQVAE